jgi:hypothetical protein
MDILLFDSMTAEESIAFATQIPGEPGYDLEPAFKFMEKAVVPLIRAHCT